MNKDKKKVKKFNSVKFINPYWKRSREMERRRNDKSKL